MGKEWELMAQIMAERGTVWRFLPPYSPDYNPIEEAFSLFKRMVRRHREDYHLNPVATILECCRRVTEKQMCGFFRDCGQPVPDTRVGVLAAATATCAAAI